MVTSNMPSSACVSAYALSNPTEFKRDPKSWPYVETTGFPQTAYSYNFNCDAGVPFLQEMPISMAFMYFGTSAYGHSAPRNKNLRNVKIRNQLNYFFFIAPSPTSRNFVFRISLSIEGALLYLFFASAISVYPALFIPNNLSEMEHNRYAIGHIAIHKSPDHSNLIPIL